MKGKTHIAGGISVKEANRLPLSLFYLMVNPSITEVAIMYFLYDYITLRPATIGSTLPDYDQTKWEYSPNTLPEPMGKAYYKYLKFRKAKHRSTYTHNIDVWTLLVGVPAFLLFGMFIYTKSPPYFYLGLWIYTLYTSILSHQFLDTLTVAGTHQSHFKTLFKSKRSLKNRKSLSVVPLNRTLYYMKPIYIGKHKTIFAKPVVSKFRETEWGRTGGGWEEEIQYKLIKFIMNRRKFVSRIIELIIIYAVFLVL